MSKARQSTSKPRRAPRGFRRLTDANGKVWFKATDAKHPDAKLIALGRKLCAALVAEDAAFRKVQITFKPLSAIRNRLDAECTRKYGRHSDKWSPGRNHATADKTPAGRAHAPNVAAWSRTTGRSHALCDQIMSLTPTTVDGLAVLALATARDSFSGGMLGFDFERPTARLVLAVCAVAGFKIPGRMRAKLIAKAR